MLQGAYFDGLSTRTRVVELSIDGESLILAGQDVNLRVPFAEVVVDERLGRAPRRLRLNSGAFCEVRDLDALDALLSRTAHRDGWVDRMQRHLHFVVFSIFACIALAFAAYRWGLPWAAAKGARWLPAEVGRTLSVQTMKLLDGN